METNLFKKQTLDNKWGIVNFIPKKLSKKSYPKKLSTNKWCKIYYPEVLSKMYVTYSMSHTLRNCKFLGDCFLSIK